MRGLWRFGNVNREDTRLRALPQAVRVYDAYQRCAGRNPARRTRGDVSVEEVAAIIDAYRHPIRLATS